MQNDETQEVQPEIEQDVELTLEEETTQEPEQEIDWKAEALKQKAINQRLSKKVAQPVENKQVLTEKKDDDIRLTVKELQMAEKKRQFGYEHSLSPEETDAVFKMTPNPTKEVLEDPFVKGGLASLRAKKRVAENTPSSSRSTGFKLPSKEGTTAEDQQKAFEEYMKNRGR
jgi:hypothetical protein